MAYCQMNCDKYIAKGLIEMNAEGWVKFGPKNKPVDYEITKKYRSKIKEFDLQKFVRECFTVCSERRKKKIERLEHFILSENSKYIKECRHKRYAQRGNTSIETKKRDKKIFKKSLWKS